MLATKIIIASEKIAQRGCGTASIINSKLSVEAAATEAYSGAAGASCRIAIPDVPAYIGDTFARAVERCFSGVECQARYVTNRLCILIVVIGRRGTISDLRDAE